MSEDASGWGASANGWLDEMGATGDFSRVHILDRPMLERVHQGKFQTALDVGCGEGRFCRMLSATGMHVIGIEPTHTLRKAAQERDLSGTYLDAIAEKLPFENDSFDLVVSYLSLIDIEGLEEAVSEMVRVLQPGGALLIANLNSFNTAGKWQRPEDQSPYFEIDDYLQERPIRISYRDISIRNWHRPLSTYMSVFLNNGLRLTHYAEPAPYGGDAKRVEQYIRSPYFNLMEWRKS